MTIADDFSEVMGAHWHVTQQGDGSVYRSGAALQLALLPDATGETYHNAQITDYEPRQTAFQYRPPLRLTVEAASSLHPSNLKGTAGFGFWNHAFAPDQRGLGLPQTLWWFFSASPSNMALAKGVPGFGWKAATMDASRWQARALLPLAPLAIPLMHNATLYNRLYPVAQRTLGIAEAALDSSLLEAVHTYELVWRPDGAVFSVDGEVVLTTPHAPRGPLGLIAWMDNQFAVVTPQGQFKMGLTSIAKPQALVLYSVKLEML